MNEYEETAKKIISATGGKDNVEEAFHCVARIRLYLKDANAINYVDLHNIPDIYEYELVKGQLQLLLGSDVNQYYQSLVKILNKEKDFNKVMRGEIKMSKSTEKDKKLAEQIIKFVGGKENVISLIHCVTRLRFKLKDEDKASDEEIKKLQGVMGIAHAGGQYQIIIGNNVTDIYEQVMPLLGLNLDEEKNENTANDSNIVNRFIKLLTKIFTPFLGTLAAAGVLKGFLVLLTVLHLLDAKSGTYMILNAAGDTLFYFLPIMVGFSTARAFNINEFVGAIIGGALCYPTLIQAYQTKQSIDFLGIPVILMSYTQTLIPAIVAVWLASILYKFLNKNLPTSLKLIFTPLLTLVVTVPITYLVVGPATSWLSQGLANVVLWVYARASILAGFVLAGIWQAVVLLGLHWAFIPIFLNNIATKGFDPINAMLYCTVFGQTGAALAMVLKARDTKFKEVGWPAVISGFLGITEPIIYGVTLPHKRSFIFGSIGSAFGGAIAAFANAKMFGGFASGGIFGIPMFIDQKAGINFSFIGFCLSLVIAFTIAFIITFIWGDRVASNENENQNSEIKYKDQQVFAPIEGTAVGLSDINDPVFSKEAIGKGIAIKPTSNEVRAPFNGTVISVFPTKHAVGLKSENGVELLIHLGIDTVNLKGKYFSSNVKDNQKIKKGDLLETFDMKKIQEAGYDTVVPVVITNSNKFADIIVEKKSGDKIKFGSPLLMAAVDQEMNISDSVQA